MIIYTIWKILNFGHVMHIQQIAIVSLHVGTNSRKSRLYMKEYQFPQQTPICINPTSMDR